MEGIGDGFGMVIIGFFLFGGILGIGILKMFSASCGTIESPTRIEPEIKLVIKNNQVDTTYVYKLK